MTRRVIAAIGLNRRAPASRHLPNDRFLAPKCVSERSRTHRAPYPKTPNRVPGSRFRAKHKCATVFGGWEESSGKSQLMEGPNVITDHIINLVRPPDVRSAARDQDIILREDANGGPKEVSIHDKRYATHARSPPPPGNHNDHER